MQLLSGLVLAGFRSLDEREDRYKEAREIVRATKVKTPVGYLQEFLQRTS